MTDVQIVNFILNHVGYDSFSNWYVGIATNESRLFEGHSVSKIYDRWAFVPALSSEHARRAESYLLNQGFDGGIGGGNMFTSNVYAFRKTTSTRR